MSVVADVQKLRERLVKQAADPIDYGDYKQQMRAYQEMLLTLIDLVGELALEVDSKKGVA